MKHITSRNIECIADAVALGNFDGLHRGHQKLINVTKKVGSATVFSFFPPTPSVVGDSPVKMILTSEEKAFMLDKMGVDLFIEYPFDKDILNMSSENFVKDILIGQLRSKAVIVGEDYRFGHRGSGDCELLYKLGRKFGFEVKVISHIMDGGSKISSTRVREAIALKDFKVSEGLMGRSYFVMGKVVRGNMIGSRIGIPTANIVPSKYKFLPPPGVYRSNVRLDGKNFRGMTNIGSRPTVANNTNKNIETHLLSFNADIYGQTIAVEFKEWVRPELKFQDLDSLRAQIVHDIAIVESTNL